MCSEVKAASYRINVICSHLSNKTIKMSYDTVKLTELAQSWLKWDKNVETRYVCCVPTLFPPPLFNSFFSLFQVL